VLCEAELLGCRKLSAEGELFGEGELFAKPDSVAGVVTGEGALLG
jgi:hypothetical protein